MMTDLEIATLDAILCDECGIIAGNDVDLKLFKDTNVCVKCAEEHDLKKCDYCDEYCGEILDKKYNREWQCCESCIDIAEREHYAYKEEKASYLCKDFCGV